MNDNAIKGIGGANILTFSMEANYNLNSNFNNKKKTQLFINLDLYILLHEPGFTYFQRIFPGPLSILFVNYKLFSKMYDLKKNIYSK